MRELPSVERGQVIAQRYVISKILRPWLSQHPAVGVVCLGVDAILDSPVVLYLAGHEHSGDLLDSARRAALLTDPRQPHVLDVLSDGGLDIVVTEERQTSSLAAVLERGPIAPQAATALVGELATVLAHAASRGLHHLCLGPEAVGLTADNDVVLTGIGIDASVANEPFGLGVESMTPGQAKRIDALALIDLYYACLSGRWPGTHDHAGIPAAGLKNNRVARLSAFVTDVPPATGEFVSDVVSGIDPGPRSPSEIVRYLEPWDTAQLAEIPRIESLSDPDPMGEKSVSPSAGASRAPEQRADLATGGSARQANDLASASTTQTPRATSAQLQAALAKVGMTRPGVHGSSAGVGGSGYSQFDDRMAMRKASTFPLAGAGADDAVEWTPDETIADYRAYADQSYDANETRPIVRDGAGLPITPADGGADDESAGPPTEALPVVPDPDEAPAAPAGDGDGDEDGSWFLGGMFTTREQEYATQRAEFEREKRLQAQAEARVRQQRADTESRLQAHRARTRPAQTPAGTPAPAAYPAHGPDEAARAGAGTAPQTGPARMAAGAPERPQRAPEGTGAPAGAAGASPVPPGAATAVAGAAAPGNRRGGRIALFVVAAVVVVGLIVFGAIALLGRDGKTSAPQAGAATSAPAAKNTGGGKSTAKAAKLASLKISKATPRDPDGDGTENNGNADKVLTGNRGSWRTDRYNNAKFGNLKKGLGIELKLKDAAAVREVRVDAAGKGGKFQIRVGGKNKPKSAKKVGSGSFSNGVTTVKTPDAPKERYVYVWITELPTVHGQNRADINSIKIYG